MGVDELGVDKMGVDEMGSRQSGNKPFDVLFSHYFVLIFTSAHEDNFHLYPRSRAICKQLLNHGGKLATIHHVVAEYTKCMGCLPSILIVDNCILFTFRRQVRLSSSSFRPVSISIFT